MLTGFLTALYRLDLLNLLLVPPSNADMIFSFLTVPSLPPQNLWANNISSTALRTKWDPVPPGFVHGILRGYRVLYRKTNEPSTQFTKITVPPEVRLSEIYDLMKFTFYTIRVLAFTIKGDGAESPPLNVTTDEDSKYGEWH